jgi:hypothetical protein
MSYYERHKKERLEYQKQYNIQHKEERVAYQKEYIKSDSYKAYQQQYYNDNKEERLAYQKLYNKSDKYKAYQQEYFQKNKERIRPKKEYVRKPLSQYKLNKLEAMLRRKIKDYFKTIYQEHVAIELAPPVISFSEKKDDTIKPFLGFTMRNNKFCLSFE